MMVLGVQVLIGFDFRAAFERGFEHLPRAAQLLKLASLSVLCVTLALLVTPGAHHRIAEHGEDSPEFHRFVSACASLALMPFALGLALDLGLAGWKGGGPVAGMVFGVGGGLFALIMWYGIELIGRLTAEGKKMAAPRDQQEKTAIADKIRHVLTEARVVLPGVQALLGFQLAAMLAEGFEKLPLSLRY